MPVSELLAGKSQRICNSLNWFKGVTFTFWIKIDRKNIFPKINSKIYKFSGFFPARYSGTSTARTGIEILGSCSAHPLPRKCKVATSLPPQYPALSRRTCNCSRKGETKRAAEKKEHVLVLVPMLFLRTKVLQGTRARFNACNWKRGYCLKSLPYIIFHYCLILHINIDKECTSFLP